MTTLVVKLTPAMAKDLARGSDALALTHEETALEAIRLFLRSVAPKSTRRRKAGNGGH